jgi:hypothetical protein
MRRPNDRLEKQTRKTMKIKNADFECNLCKSDKISRDGFHGATYAQTIGNREDFVGSELVEYSITCTLENSAKRETLGHREVSRSRGKTVAQIGKSALRDELVILPGAAMSASDVLRALRKYIAEVEQNGMYIGRYKDAIIIEKINGSLEAV